MVILYGVLVQIIFLQPISMRQVQIHVQFASMTRTNQQPQDAVVRSSVPAVWSRRCVSRHTALPVEPHSDR